jgi:hypothetical protein
VGEIAHLAGPARREDRARVNVGNHGTGRICVALGKGAVLRQPRIGRTEKARAARALVHDIVSRKCNKYDCTKKTW